MGVFSVPVTIGVNEEEIARNIEANVEKQVVDKIKKEVETEMYGGYGVSRYVYDNETPVKSMIRGEILKVIENDKERIIKLAADILADKLIRTKAVKEAAGETAKKVYKPAWVEVKEKSDGQ